MSATALDAPEERHDWTGLYVGGFVGGAAGTRATTTQPNSPGNNGWNNAAEATYSCLTKAAAMGEVQLAIIGNLGDHLM